MVEDFPDLKLIGQSFKIVEDLFYLGGTIGAREGTYGSVIARIRSRLSKCRDIVP